MRLPFAVGSFAIAAWLAPQAAIAGIVVLFEHQNFEGQRLTLRGDMPNLDRTDFNDRTESIFVRDGTWEVCTDAGFRGQCLRLGPGEYRNLTGEFTRSISSLRQVRGGPPPGLLPSSPPQRMGRPHAELFEDPNFGGREALIEDQIVTNFEDLGFNDRAASLKIVGGYWQFCTDANFQGMCRIFGPGEYPRLPGDIANRISSGRRIQQQDLPVRPQGQR